MKKPQFLKFVLLSLLVSFVMISCKESSTKMKDNLFKYKEYIFYTTSGVVSTVQPIKIMLAKDVPSWEVNKEITNAVFTISPSVKGKLQVQNKRTLIFKPDTPLKANTEYKPYSIPQPLTRAAFYLLPR